jgi:hypothetical protein
MKALLKIPTRIFSVIASLILISTSVQSHEGTLAPDEHCLQFKNNTLHVHAKFSTPPTVMKKGSLQLQVLDAKSQQAIALNGQDKIAVSLWMPDMGHGSAPTQIQPLPAVGAYAVSNLYFTMDGLWQVRVQLKSATSEVETQLFEVVL